MCSFTRSVGPIRVSSAGQSYFPRYPHFGHLSMWPRLPVASGSKLLMFFPERLDLHIHAGREIKLHQRIYGLRRRIANIEQALVRADLELLTRSLVHVRRTKYGILVLDRVHRNRSRDL